MVVKKESKKPFKIVCVIASHERKLITTENIKLLQKQTLPLYRIILVGDSDIEKEIGEETGCDVHITKNKPLSNKWQSGIDIAKMYNPDAVLINGSDNLLSLNWCEKCSEYIKKGYDLVGKNHWYICRAMKNEKIELIKRTYNPSRNYLHVGAGRLISKRILDKMNWRWFPKGLNSSLDTRSYANMRRFGGKPILLNKDESLIVIGVKGGWGCKNPWRSMKDSRMLVHLSNIPNSKQWFTANFPSGMEVINKVSPRAGW